jgi:C4-dicarboxylate transporter DctM subunit
MNPDPAGHSHRTPGATGSDSGSTQPKGTRLPAPETKHLGGFRLCRWLHGLEDGLVTAALAAMVLLPLAEIVLRRLNIWRVGIVNVSGLEQHLTLVVGMLGGAIAARQGRLLTLSTVGTVLKGSWRTLASVVSGGVGMAVSVFLAWAAWQFVGLERQAPKPLAYGIPIWVVELVMPIGFAVVAARLGWHAASSWKGRAAALLLAGLVCGLCLKPPIAPAHLVVGLLAGLVLAAGLGLPVFAVLGGAALVLFWGRDISIIVLAQEHYKQVVNPALPTIPLFTLAGYFLAEGGASQRLIRVFQALVGSLRGGPAIVTALVCAFFTTFTGASGVTILALGGLLMPVLRAAGYSERASLGLLTGSGSLGLLFPPCLPVILYAIIAQIEMKDLFLAGLGPGLLLVLLVAIWAVSQSPRQPDQAVRFDLKELGRAVNAAKWELLLPVVTLVTLFSGWATPVEAAAVTALYAFVIETWIYRELKLARDVPRVMTECGLLIGGVLLILGVAMGLTNYLVDAQVPDRAVEWATGAIRSKWLFLLAVNAVLLVVGCLMDIYSAIVVVVPILVPLGQAFGINPMHLGIVFLANLQAGYLTPPVGMNLFLASYRFNKPLPEVIRAALPMLLVFLVGVLLITYFPPLSIWLPGRLK